MKKTVPIIKKYGIKNLFASCLLMLFCIAVSNRTIAQGVSNVCPAATVNLTSLVTSSAPSGSVITYHTGTPASNDNKISTANAEQISTDGAYYIAYYNAAQECYSPTSAAINVTISVCCPTTAPTLSASTLANNCPNLNTNLNSLHTGTSPEGSTLVWYTNNTHSGSAYALSNQAVAGTYYAFYYNESGSCYSPASNAVIVSINSCTTNLSNTCPSSNVDLTSFVSSSAPAGTLITYHTGTPASNANKISTSDAEQITSSSGPYYVAYYDESEDCYSPTSNPIMVDIAVCCPTVAPSLGASTVANTCPDTTVNLNALHTGTSPEGSTLVWFTNNTHTGAAYATANKANAGTYYAFYFNESGNCYSPASNAVAVSINSCITNISNTCPSSSVDLTSLVSSSAPAGSIITYHTGTPASNANKISTSDVEQITSSSGPYYVAYYDDSEDCYSPTSSAIMVNIATCCPTVAPALGVSTVTNTCPDTTVNLNALHTGTSPEGSTLVWFTNNTHTGAAYATANKANAGTYYAFYYNESGNCYSPASNPVAVNINSCIINLSNTCPSSSVDLTSLVSSSAPSGSIVTYHNGTPASNANKISTSDVEQITSSSGPYYVAYYDDSEDCYSPTSSAIMITIDECFYANNDSASTNEDTPVTLSLTNNDLGNIDSSTVDLDPTTAGIQTTLTTADGKWSVNKLGVLTFVPKLNFNGTAKISYTIKDKNNNTSNIADVIVKVISVNDTIVVNNEYPSGNEDSPINGSILTNDSDVEGAVTVNTNPLVDPKHGDIVINNDGTFTYTPDANFIGKDTVVVNVCDNGAPATCKNDTLFISINPLNDAPKATDDIASTTEDTPVLIDVVLNDTDVDGTLNATTVSIVSGPTHGTLSIDPVTGKITYTPSSNYSGSDVFTYSVCDNGTPVFCDEATVTISVTAVNDAPIATDDSENTLMDNPVVINVASNDTDIDGTINVASVSIVSSPTHGTLSVDPLTGKITYTPNSNYSGSDVFTYSVCDNGTPVLCDEATVVINIGNPPVVIDDNIYSNGDDDIVIKILNNDNINSKFVSLNVIVEPKNGTFNVDNNGNIIYSPNGICSSKDSLQYVLCSDIACDTAWVIINIVCPEDILITEGFSPNGDGKNDVFEIKNIELYPNNEIIIFNRWGTKIFGKQGYNNDWDGTSESNLTTGSGSLPEGTYFYILTLKSAKGNRDRKHQGYIFLKR